MPRVETTIEDHIAHVRLTRGDKHNAVDEAMMTAVVEAGQSLMDADIRCVVLSGEGPSFCAGLDVMSFASFATRDPEEMLMPRSQGNTNMFQEFAMVWRRLAVPVIAAVHGAAYGAGFQLSLGADMRVAHPDAKLSVMEMKWGLIPDMGGTVLLRRLVRSDVMRQMVYTARPIKADQAERCGLVTQVSEDPFATARDLALEIAGKSPSAMRAAKRIIGASDAGMEEDALLLEESREQAALIGGKDQMEVVAANMAGRAPKFS
ncbi:MAG: crotonase/enoyl-CoA hydratase family protein [Pseudomonadota bacterium]